jgi:hypothetical protein
MNLVNGLLVNVVTAIVTLYALLQLIIRMMTIFDSEYNLNQLHNEGLHLWMIVQVYKLLHTKQGLALTVEVLFYGSTVIYQSPWYRVWIIKFTLYKYSLEYLQAESKQTRGRSVKYWSDGTEHNLVKYRCLSEVQADGTECNNVTWLHRVIFKLS